MEISPVLKILLVVILRTAVNGQKELVVTQPAVVEAKAGDSVTISCSFTSSSPTYIVTWTSGCNLTALPLQNHPCFQRRVQISTPDPVQIPQDEQVSSYKSKTTVTINNLTENDSGVICCNVKTGDRENGVGPGTRLEVAPRSPAECLNDEYLVVEIIRIICLIILIILLGLVLKKSC